MSRDSTVEHSTHKTMREQRLGLRSWAPGCRAKRRLEGEPGRPQATLGAALLLAIDPT